MSDSVHFMVKKVCEITEYNDVHIMGMGQDQLLIFLKKRKIFFFF